MMDIEKFGEVINTLLTDTDYQLLLHMPEGTQKMILKDNLNMGPTVHFYALLRGLIAALEEFISYLDPDKIEEFVDEVLAMVKEEIMKAESEE